MTGCVHEENIEHLVDCTLIRRGFWTKIEALMRALNMKPGCRLVWLFGLKPGRNRWEPADPEEAAMINWAWRALYAEVTRAHIDGKTTGHRRSIREICASSAHATASIRVQVVLLVFATTVPGIPQSSPPEAQTKKN